MRIELDRRTFRRLVQLYLLLFALGIGLSIVELLVPRWHGFDLAFEKLVQKQFGPPVLDTLDTVQLVIVGLVLLGVLVAGVVAEFGLLRFRSWARTLFFSTAVLATVVSWLIFPPVTWTSNAMEFLSWLSAMVEGAILLLAYSDRGAEWFGTAPTQPD